MREMTEQEKLLALYRAGERNDEAGDFDSADLLTQGLMSQLGRPNQQKIMEIEREIVSSGDELDHAPLTSFSGNGNNNRKTVQAQQEPERDLRLIAALQKIHSGLIDVFERSGLNSGVEGSLVNLIDVTGSCLVHLGERAERFEPLRHLSGLEAPNMVKNANKVVETTLTCYKIGSVEESVVSDDGSTIEIVFAGKSRNIEYRAFGQVEAQSWEGSEAIDYIYTPGSGKMSVKAFEGGKWVDKSDEYTINWTLEEKDTSLEGKTEVTVNNSTIEKMETVVSEKISEDKEGVSSTPLNNEDDEEIGDFPIND